MTLVPFVSQKIAVSNPCLWAVKTYLDLISRDDPLVYGTGLKRLYTLSTGLATFNDYDIEAATKKAEGLGLIPHSLYSFMIDAILKNCLIYGQILKEMIDDRIVSIANGDVENPDRQVNWDFSSSRRNYYIPPAPFIKRVQKVLIEDSGIDSNYRQPVVVRLQDVANEADFILTQYTANEGHIAPQSSSWGALGKVVERLLGKLENEANYPIDDRDYRRRSRAALKILWFIAKLLYADLSVKPDRKDLNLVDLDQRLSMSDGTLAAIPFPIPQTIHLFEDSYESPVGITMKGRYYLGAVSAAAFDRKNLKNEG